MKTLQDIKELILWSLDLAPANVDELLKRDFLHNRSRSGIERLLTILEQEGKIYEKNNKFHAYKKAIRDLNKRY